EELLGRSTHGFLRMASILAAAEVMDPKAGSLDVRRINEFATKVTASNVLGLVAAKHASDIACDNAARSGMSLTGLTGYKGNTGALGYYARIFAKQGLVSVICCTAMSMVAPWGGKDPVFGTNPIAISIPNGDNPIIIDFSTAAMTYGGLMLAAKEHRPVPYGVILDRDGRPTTDPMDSKDGCLLPMAEHKGYALALAVEILGGLFIGAKSGRNAVPGSSGVTILAFKPDLFISQEDYLRNVSALIDEILSSSLAAESKGIRLPGQNSLATIESKRKSGECEVPDVVYKEIVGLYNKL
nr:Ldh family oxidoreductase [Clostridia bacterium]